MARPNKSADQTPTVSVSLRINPRVKYGIDLAARIQKRTVTGVVEWAVDKALADVLMPASILINDEDPAAPNDLAAQLDDLLWSTNEGVRLVLLASRYPSLLSYEETRIWETIKLSPPFWNKLPRSAEDCTPWANAKLDVVADNWDTIIGLVSSRKNVSAITYADIGQPLDLEALHMEQIMLETHLERLLIKDPELLTQVKELERMRDNVMLAIHEEYSRFRAAELRKSERSKPDASK